jgi:hypothetical protein
MSSLGGARYHLIVERLPRRDHWDWTVWRPGDARKIARHGNAPSVPAAMRAATAAVQEWGNSAATGAPTDP